MGDNFDWREKWVILPIRQQYSSHSCWAFGSVSAVESLNCIQNGQLTGLSEQQLIDCAVGTRGCKGGAITASFKHIIERLDTGKIDPYSGKDGYIPKGDENELKKAVERQPVATCIAINFRSRTYQIKPVAGEIVALVLCHHRKSAENIFGMTSSDKEVMIKVRKHKKKRKFWKLKRKPSITMTIILCIES
ncbi:hypothetical protein ACJIZ3_023391 [Penstemon smallii]|uniref:Peptidase C1A papain C-terminal domain-containing protein n=1 Tax=Penstemon smallii TaxID=265156 RepID=A0ABD3TQ01_9LAMI